MRPRSILFAILFASAIAVAQVEKPADNTKVFGAPPPNRPDKKMLREVIGVVTDPSGNPVPSALVFLKDLKDNKERSIVATPQGTYKFDDLVKNQDYQLRAAKGRLLSPVKTLSSFDTRVKPVMNLQLDNPPANPAPAAPEAKK